MLHKSKNCYVRSDDNLVAAVGLDDLVIVATKDAVMVAHKDSVQDAKLIVQQLKDKDRPEWKLNREVYRPWGKYDCVDNGNGYQVKRLTVNPGAKLSDNCDFDIDVIYLQNRDDFVIRCCCYNGRLRRNFHHKRLQERRLPGAIVLH